jgi:SAM-dependent methyltransferase
MIKEKNGEYEESLKKINCVICDSNDTSHIYTTKDMLYGLDGEFKIERCNCCLTEFVVPFPTAEFLSSLYSSENYYSFNQRKINKLSRILRKRTRRLFPTLKSLKNTICDVGCGDGEFLDFAREVGFETFGVEQDGQAQFLSTQTLHKIHPSIAEHKKNFDYIRSNHALEHVHDIKKIMLDMKNHLAVDGLILIGVPNAQGFIAKLFGKYWFYRGAPIHTMGLNEKSFKIICDNIDLEIVKVAKRQTFRGTIGSVIIATENFLFGKSMEPTTIKFLLMTPFILVAMPFNFLLTIFKKGDLLEMVIRHKSTVNRMN